MTCGSNATYRHTQQGPIQDLKLGGGEVRGPGDGSPQWCPRQSPSTRPAEQGRLIHVCFIGLYDS